MEKQLVRLLLFASAVLIPCAQVFAQKAPLLRQPDLRQPELVSAWLEENGEKADKATAGKLFQLGQQSKAKKNWSAAGKAFVESAMRFPTPYALNEYAESSIQSAGKKLDPRFVVPLYHSALAADSILGMMSEEEKKATQNKAECLDAYIRTKEALANCAPLQAYGLIK